ncbi:hypothetical protein WJX73_003750 [Symbiochloris irregularis]|uniref:F-box domain-containing protein n=1 Tax=Symbiochloris irregularis TaxID=706552 RepID=A0AAW1PZB2_9CHLO
MDLIVCPTCKQSLPPPIERLWQEWFDVFTHLDFISKVRCQSVCKAWNGLLRQPAAGVWGTVVLGSEGKLGRWSEANRTTPSLEFDSALQRWIQPRSVGIIGLLIEFEGWTTILREREGQRTFFECYLGYFQDLPWELTFKVGHLPGLLGAPNNNGSGLWDVSGELGRRLVCLHMRCTMGSSDYALLAKQDPGPSQTPGPAELSEVSLSG